MEIETILMRVSIKISRFIEVFRSDPENGFECEVFSVYQFRLWQHR